MTIRNKAIVTLAIGTVVLMAASVLFITRLFSQKMDSLEVEKAALDVERINEAINSEVDNLNSKTADWSIWDDSYKFVEDKNPEYIASNLYDSASFESMRLSFMVFVDLSGNVVYKKGYDFQSKKEIEIPLNVEQYLINTQSSLLKFKDITDSHAGMIMVGNDLYVVSSRPILKSNAEGPSKGAIIFGRHFDNSEINNIAKITKQENIIINKLDNLNIENITVTAIDEKTLEGKNIIKDIFNNPIAYYSINIPRDIHLQGAQGVKYITLFLVGISTAFFIVTILFLSVYVLSPIKNITKSVNLIAHSQDITSRIKFSGDDELGSLSRDINIMLGSLQLSKDRAFAEAEKSKSFFDVVSGIVLIIDKNGNISSINKKGAEYLGYTVDELIGKNWFNNFIPENEKAKVKNTFDDLLLKKDEVDTTYQENYILTKSGKIVLIGWYNSLLKDQNGDVIATVSHGEDITDKKKEEEQDRMQKEELERLNQLMMGRELKMVELKREISKLKTQEGDNS